MIQAAQRLRILDFDIENRPLSYWWSDRPSAEVTGIAWSWMGKREVRCALLGEVSLPEVLESFHEAYQQADIVTGHYIRRHDLPIINGARIELGLAPLSEKLTRDTKLDLPKKGDLPVDQESLADYLGVRAQKKHMSQADWRAANRLTPEGLEQTRKRVVGDVRQHKAMYQKLVERKLLGPPKLWRP